MTAQRVVRLGITATDAYKARYYSAALAACGAETEILPNRSDDAFALATACDGIVISGGVDVEAWRYGGDAERTERDLVPERDAFELAVVGVVREERIPVLLICRGMQVANVAFGGTLIEDLLSEPGASYVDHAYALGDPYRHRVRLEPGRLADIAQTNEIETNSRHHQALRKVAPKLRVVGRSDDGVIEAVEATFEHPFFVGVQWHPENLALLDDPPSRRLFEAFVVAARERRAARTEETACA